jgi:hypothetical protein
MKKTLTLLVLVALAVYPQNWLRVDSIFAPFGVIAQNFSCPAFSDIDADGDYDLFLGNINDQVDYFKNIGSKTNPKYAKDTSMLSSIYSGGAMGTNADYPALIDIDNDKDFDLIIGGYNGLLLYLNNGDSLHAVWRKDTIIFVSVNPQIGSDAKPCFGDLDNDGDKDLLVGIGESLLGGPTPGITMGFRNNGTATAPNFVLDNSLVSGIPDIGLNSYPALADLNNDGDLDLLLGRDLQTFVYYQNNGTPANPVWSINSSLFSGVETSNYWKNPTFCDLDGDGDRDLIYGQSSGKLYFYKNIGNVTTPSFSYDASYFNSVRLDGNASTVSIADFDNDGDKDLLSGIWTGKFQYFKNNGTSSNPVFQLSTSSFSNLNPGSYSSPMFIDLDGDNDLDIVSGALNGKLFCYLNNNGTFSANTTIFAAINVNGFSYPAFADLDFDGDLDLFVGAEYSSNCKFFINTGNNIFVQNDSMLTGVSYSSNCSPTFSDIDNDGDFDLLYGKLNGSLVYYKNNGTKFNPVWQLNDSLFAGIKAKQNSHPGFADLDGDGRKDLVLGEYDGNFTYYKNLFALTETEDENSINPYDFTLYQNYPNPFNPITRIKFSLQSTKHVTLKVFDILGNETAMLLSEEKQPGIYEVEFNSQNSAICSGVYFYQLCSGNFTATRKMIIIK